MKKSAWLVAVGLLISLAMMGQKKQNKLYLEYIDQYSGIAVDEMEAYGIPASITMAQGLLESGAGRSQLTKESNNHFGIKCRKDWKGERVYHDDDQKGECFRKYKSAKESYEDHSQFLKRNPRYASLFQLQKTDYKGWARGLKKAGYATDPKYADRLIDIIETYELQNLDTKKGVKKATAQVDNGALTVADSTKSATGKHGRMKLKKTRVKGAGGGLMGWLKMRVGKTDEEKDLERVYAEKDTAAVGEIYAYRVHKVEKINGVKYVVAQEGDTYELIAEEFGKFERELLKANEVQYGAELKAGDIVYIEKKKKEGKQSTYKVQKGETVYAISQKTGVRSRKIYDMNGLVYGKQVSEGDVIKLRK